MQVFKHNQLWLTWLGISSKRLHEPTNDFFTTINAYVMIVSMVVSMPICGTYALYLSRDDFQRLFQAFYIVSAGIQCVGSYLSIGNNMISVKSVMNEAQRISDSVRGTDAGTIYHDTEMICRRFTKLIITMMLHLSNVVWGLFLFNSFFQLWMGNRDTATWIAPFNIAVPFETSTVFRWYIFYMVQGLLAYSYSLNQPIIITFFMSCCLYTEALCKHFRLAIRATECDDGGAGSSIARADAAAQMTTNLLIRKRFVAAVQLHAKLMEIFDTTDDIFSGVIFVQLPMNTLFFALSLLQNEQYIQTFSILTIYGFISFFISVEWVFIFCYLGTRANVAMESIPHAMYYETDWLRYPVSFQKHVQFVLMRSQKSFYYSGFRIFRCSLETFTMLNKSAWSYFFMFRSVSD